MFVGRTCPLDAWYSELRHEIKQKFSRRCFDQGISAMTKSTGCYEPDLKVICAFLLSEDSLKNIASRCHLLTEYHCAGRAGEIKHTVYDHMTFDSNARCLALDWAQSKTGKEKTCNIFPHRNDFKVCPFHALFCYFVSTGHRSSTSPFVFDEMQGAKPGSHVNAAFHYFYEKSNLAFTIQQGLTAKSLRTGSCNVIAECVGLNAAIHRGDWSMEQICAAFEYLTNTSESDKKAGRALSGHPLVGSGRSTILTDIDQLNFEKPAFDSSIFHLLVNVVNDLFMLHELNFPMRSALFATFLCHLRDFYRTYPHSSTTKRVV